MKKILCIVIFSFFIVLNAFATDTAITSLGVDKWMTNDPTLAFEMFPQLLTSQRNMASIETSITDTDGWLNLDIGAGSLGVLINRDTNTGFTAIKQSGLIYGWRNFDMAAGGGVFFGQKEDEEINLGTEAPLDLGGDRTLSGDSIIRLAAGFSLLQGLPLDVGITVDIPEDINQFKEEFDDAGILTSELNDTERGLEPALNVRLAAFDALFIANVDYNFEDDLYIDKKYTAGSLSYYEELKEETKALSAWIGASKTFKSGNFTLTAGIEAWLYNIYNSQTAKDMITDTDTDGLDESNWTYISPAILYLGLEIKLADFFKVRFGINKEAWTTTYHEVTDRDAAGDVSLHTKETKRGYGPVNFSAGVGFNAAGAEVDILVSNDLIYNGPSIISGLQTAWMTKAGVSYTWE